MTRAARFRWLLLLLAPCVLAGCEMSQERYVDLLTRAHGAMTAKQDRLRREFRLGEHPRYDYDEATGILVFSDSGMARVLADVEFVGDVSRRDGTWRWSWDLPYVPPALADAAGEARLYGWLHGIPKLRRSGWEADDVDGWEMTSLTGWIAGAEGAYRAPSSDSTAYTFMLLRNVRWAPPGRPADSYLTSPRAGESGRRDPGLP